MKSYIKARNLQDLCIGLFMFECQISLLYLYKQKFFIALIASSYKV